MGKKSTEGRKVDLRHSTNNPGIGAMPWDFDPQRSFTDTRPCPNFPTYCRQRLSPPLFSERCCMWCEDTKRMERALHTERFSARALQKGLPFTMSNGVDYDSRWHAPPIQTASSAPCSKRTRQAKHKLEWHRHTMHQSQEEGPYSQGPGADGLSIAPVARNKGLRADACHEAMETKDEAILEGFCTGASIRMIRECVERCRSAQRKGSASIEQDCLLKGCEEKGGDCVLLIRRAGVLRHSRGVGGPRRDRNLGHGAATKELTSDSSYGGLASSGQFLHSVSLSCALLRVPPGVTEWAPPVALTNTWGKSSPLE